MSPSAIYSKSGKGVQEASGKTSLLARSDRAVLSAFDGKMTLQEVAEKVGKPFDAKFEALIAQLDKDGFVRQVSAGAPTPTTPKPAASAAAKPAPAAKAPGEDLDFTIAMPSPKAAAPKPAAPPPAPPVAPQMAQSNAAAFAKAREEAEEKAAKERDRIKAETEAKMRAEMEAKMRSEAELKAKSDAEARVRAEAEAKVKAARDAAARVAAEAKAKAEAEAAAKLEAERARVREAEEKARKEAEAVKRAAEEAKRKAEEEARKAREEAERIRKEAEEAKRAAEEAKRKAEEEARRIREEAERRAKEEEQRRAKEEAERKAREAREKQEREKAEAERKAREQQEREARAQKEREEEAREEEERQARKAREKAEREQREREEEEREEAERQAKKARERAAREEADQAAAAAPAPKAAPQPSPKADFGDSLLADLDSFSQREDEDRKAQEEATRKEKEAAARRAKEAEEEAKRKAEREEREEAERKEKERKRKEEEARAKEEEERRQREEQEREREKQEAERRRKARAKEETKGAPADDIPVSDEDLDMDEVKKDEAALSKESRRAAREREERERQAKKDAKREAKREAKEAKEEKRPKREEPAYSAPPQFRRPRKWGKTVSMTLFLLLIAGVGALHVMPISTAEYEKAAGDAIGRPVKISSARLSLYSGVMLKFDGVSIGDAKIAAARAFPEIGSLFSEKKAFSRIELDGVSVPPESIGALFGAKVRGDNFTVSRITARQVKVTGPVPLPTLEVDLALGSDGAVTSTSLRGADGLSGKLTPKNANEMDVDVVATSFTVPILPDMTLSGFALKGVATRDGIRIESWGGGQLDGAVAGSANIRWSGGNWTIDGVMTVRGINAAVFAPALLSEGKAEGSGRFSFNDSDPMAFLGRGRIEGTFSVHKGVLGSFDLSRAITTGGRQVGGRTPFTGMSGQGVFDKGSVALRNVSFGAGALNAGASADISADGNLSGRIVADVRTPSQTLRATLNLGGTVRDPQVRN